MGLVLISKKNPAEAGLCFLLNTFEVGVVIALVVDEAPAGISHRRAGITTRCADAAVCTAAVTAEAKLDALRVSRARPVNDQWRRSQIVGLDVRTNTALKVPVA